MKSPLSFRSSRRILAIAAPAAITLTLAGGLVNCVSRSGGSSAHSFTSVESIDLGGYSRCVMTSSPDAQRHVDAGLRTDKDVATIYARSRARTRRARAAPAAPSPGAWRRRRR